MYSYGYKKKGFDFGDFKITPREIIASISIIALLIVLGLFISGKIAENQENKNAIYNKALKVETTDMFKHGMETNVGNAFVYGDLESISSVTYDEIGGEYMYVEKIEKRYERHERTVTKEDSEGNTYTEIEEYYTWDTEDTDSKHVDRIKFCNVEFPYSKISKPMEDHIDTIYGERVYSWKSGEYVKVKFEYYGISTKYTGTIYTELKDNTISDDTKFFQNKTIEESVEYLQSSSGVVVFWIFWSLLIAACVFGFFYLENKWLE